MSRRLRVIAAVLLLLCLRPATAADAGCPDAELFSGKLVTDICWGCLFPIRIAGLSIGGGDRPAAASDQVVCACNDGLGIPHPGFVVSLWEPARILELTRAPACSPALGGIRLPLGSRRLLGTAGKSEWDASDISFYNYHWYAFPLLTLLDLFFEDRCNADGMVDFDILYLSELDPTWNSGELAFFTNPEAAWLANPVALAACLADAAAASAGTPIDSLFWCAGTWGLLYPFSGAMPNYGSRPSETSLSAARALAALHRRGLARRTMGNDALCSAPIDPFLHKSQYRMSMFYPLPETQFNHVIGESAFRWGEWRSLPGPGRITCICCGAGMTAARLSEALPLRFDRHGWPARVLAGLLCVTTAWVPWALAWGDAVSDAGRAAQGEGRALANGVTLPQVNENSLTLFPGQPNQTQLDFDTVFPGSAGGNPADYTNLFGNDMDVINAGRAAQTDLPLDDSATGAAYQTLRGSVDRSRPDMLNDPLWSQTDDVLDNFEDLAASFADCSIDTRFTEGERRTHVPDIQTCERVADYSGACDIRHVYTIEQILENGAGGTFAECGDGCILWTVGQAFPTGPCYQELTGTMRILKPEAILSAQVEDLWYEDYIAGLWIDGNNHYAHVGGECENDGSPSVWLGHDVSGYFKTAGEKRVLLALIQGGDLGGGTVRVRIRFDPTKALVADVWEDVPACLDLVRAIGDGACEGPIQCAAMPALTDGCIPITGGRICAGDLLPSPVAGISSFCRNITVSADCSGFYQGQMDCWTDPQGVLRCPYNHGGVETDCTALEDDPNCGFLSSSCVKYAQGASGLCYVFEERWDCGTLHGIPVLERTSTMDCAGPVRCMGEDCLDAAEEQSGDFAKAAAALQAAQMAASDMDCSSGSCVVFSGEAMECKKAVGGIVNCCTTPDGISLADYISLVFAVGKLDNALMGLDRGNALRGSWETLRQPVASAWSEVTKSFTSVANNLMGKTAAEATDAAARLSLDAFKQAVMQQTAQWVAEIFGEAAANTLFTVNGGAAFVGGNLQAGTIQLGGLIGTALSWVMTAYMIYSIAVILIQLIWTCEEEEFELGAKRELRSCHDVGSYCKTKVLTACIERRKAYCCFNTPLARILNEQLRPQLGRGWGVADGPDCTGIAVADFGRVDWDRVNLDEWLAILAETGHFPTLDSLNLDALTGTGSALDVSGARPDAAARSQTRSDGLDTDAARREAETELWESTLPALP